MAHRFIIRAETQGPASLKQNVKVIFTITPTESKYSYNPVAMKPVIFGSDDGKLREEFQWQLDLAFSTYVTKQHMGKRVCALGVAKSECLQPGYYASLVGHSGQVKWKGPIKHSGHPEHSILAHSYTGSPELVALGTYYSNSEGNRSLIPMVAYQSPLGSNSFITVQPDFVLQAYVVDNSASYDDAILSPKDLTQPLFAEFLKFDRRLTNPTEQLSRWKLCQQPDDAIKLEVDDEPEFNPSPKPESDLHSLGRNFDDQTKLMSDMSDQLATVLKTLSDIQDRLTLVERSVIHAHDDIASGQQAVTEIRNRLSVIEKSSGSTWQGAAPKAKTPLEGSGSFHDQSDYVQDRGLPTLGARTDKLENSFNHTQEYLSSVQRFLQTTRQHVIELDRRIPAVEAKENKLTESFGKTQDTLLSVEVSLAVLDSRVAVVEKRSDSLTESLEQIRDAGGAWPPPIGTDDEFPAMLPSRPQGAHVPPSDPPATLDPALDLDLPKLPDFEYH